MQIINYILMLLYTKKVYNFSEKIWWLSLCAITLEFRN
jgi:hypothetical protein